MDRTDAKSTWKLPEVLAWALLAFLAAIAMRLFQPKPLSDDSYQYLNVAEHLKQDRQLVTSLIHFDTERSHGRIPAPLTSFPPAYPAAVAIAGFSGDFEGAARLLSCLCYAGTAALLAWALILTGVTPPIRQFALLLFVTNAAALGFATSVLSEPLFVLLSTGAAVALLWAEADALPKRAAMIRAAAAFLLAGLAYWVRYAGLFLIAPMIGYAVLRLFLPGTRFRTAFLPASLIPIALAGGVMLHNLAAVGTWKGGHDLIFRNSFKTVMAAYAKIQLHLILGRHAAAFGVWETLLLAGGLGIAVFFFTSRDRDRTSRDRKGAVATVVLEHRAALWLTLYVLAYSAGIIYTGMRLVSAIDTRMFVPMLPLYLLLVAMGLNSLAGVSSPWLKIAILLAAVGYAGVNARDLYEPASPAPHEILAAQYAKPSADGRPLLQWVESHLATDDVILAADGQATGYFLHRPTISMVSAQCSPVRWECDEVKKQMKRFKANYVFLYKPSSPVNEDSLLDESRFVAASVSRPPSCGFAIAAENPNVRILKLADRN